MATVTLRGNPIRVDGQFPAPGQTAPAFSLVKGDLSDATLAGFGGQRKILNIFPSVDTPTCATSVRKFNAQASGLDNAVVLCISADLPFAQARFCGAEGLDKVVNLSTLRGREFLQDYGVAIAEGPLVGLAARAVVVLDADNKVLHSELVAEVGDEPDYAAALAVLACTRRHEHMTAAFILRAGPLARRHIEQHGFAPDSLAAFGAPAGGPKFMVLAGLDRHLFGEWLPQRSRPLPAFGSSIGAFRLVAAAHRDPAAAMDRLVTSYCAQHYASKPDAGEITRQVRVILDAMLSADDLDHILAHPWLRLNLITTRCQGLAASRQSAVQAMGFALAFMGNLRHRDHLAGSFERCVFHNHAEPGATLRADAFRTHHAALTRDNLAAATLASGTIPLMMKTVRDIPAGPPGAHIDGGMIDYHMDLALRDEQDGILFIPHYEQRVVPGWFDKGLKRRPTRHTDRMLVLSPDPAHVARLPGGKIPCRKDFKRYHQRDAERLLAWRAGLDLSERIADEFRDMVAKDTVMTRLQPL